ncbi:hypothetical protein MIR68_008935 [Amoeboaphelidium protococcarum]|nr:hypothetical protein MIR68_008935 [Amoeboaphelidium protococcarum]
MSDLPALLKRLETVTTRLEDLSARGGVSAPQANGQKSAVSGSGADSGASSPSIEAFDEIVNGPVKQLVELGNKIGGLVAEQTACFQKAFEAQRQLLVAASKSKKPDTQTFQSLLAPTAGFIGKIQELREKNRTSPLFNHLSTLSEGVPALSWVAVEPKPAPFVGEMKDASTFYSNRILSTYKDKEPVHVDFAKAFGQVLVDLQAFVKKYHTTGLVWNANGGDAKQFVGASAAPSTATSQPQSQQAAASTPAAQQAASTKPSGNLFAELNKGGDITSGLKKVEKSQMTHKNPALRAGSVVKSEESAAAPSAASNKAGASHSAPARGPAKFALEGNKWFVENYDGKKDIVIENAEMRQGAYIFGCNNCTIQIKGKIGAVTVDSCKKTAVVVENVVSSFDVVNCKSLQAQILGRAPTAVIDKTDGLNLFLSKECLDIEIFTAKSSELNVSIPPPKEGQDFIEKPLAEQMKTTIVNGGIKTEIVEHKG